MFELLWNERMLNEESFKDYKLQEEFMNIAAHELRSPAQSILGYTELLISDPKYAELDKEQGFLDAIYRNSMRLSRLTKELLDISRIENQTLQLRKQKFQLNKVIPLVIQDIRKQRQELGRRGSDYANAKIILVPSLVEKGYDNSADIFVEADKERIVQVLTNLLDNAPKIYWAKRHNFGYSTNTTE
jgi:two-component system sensor histidine kinase VicK